jgi:hypothetical protein
MAIESLSYVCAFWVFIKRSQLLIGEMCLVASDPIGHSLGTMAYYIGASLKFHEIYKLS